MSAAELPWRQYICLACGLIYDEEQGDPDSGLAPGTRFEDIPEDWECPLCGVTKTDFELLEKQAITAVAASTNFSHEPGIVVVGAGVAGWSAVEAIRVLDSEVPITLISACSADRYHKPELSIALSRGRCAEDLVRESGTVAAERLGVRLLNHTFLVGLSPALHQVRTTRGSLTYTQLVVAQGATPALPAELPAAECWRVNDLRGWAGLQASLGSPESDVAVVGAGMIGCELAEDLSNAGHKVTLIDRNAYPLCGLIPPEAGMALQESLAAQDISFINDAQVQSVSRLASGKRSIRFKNGDSIQVDQIIAATGLKTDDRLARMAGLAFDRGIKVGPDTLQTSVDGIYALGDCISLEGAPCRFIEPIQHQARAIAHAVLNLESEPYRHAMPVIRLKTRSLPLVIHGLPHPDGQWKISDQTDGRLEMQQYLGQEIVSTLNLGQSRSSKAA